jgi:hypothetical protein
MESSTRPCGGGNYTSVATDNWSAGVNASCVWYVVSGAGQGQVHARIDPTGGTNFTVGYYPIGFFQPAFIDTNTLYTVYFVVPGVQCTGTNNTCTMQFWTDSGGGWYACATIQITCKGCTEGVPVSREQCVDAEGLSYCTNSDGMQVYVPTGETPSQIDAVASYEFEKNYNDPSIFTNGNSTECMTAYKEMLCALYLYPCGTSKSSYSASQCQQTLTTCGLTEAQSTLYDCNVFACGVSLSPLVLLVLCAFSLLML